MVVSNRLCIDKLNVKYQDGDAYVEVLSDLDLEVSCGEIVFVLGRNGSGKTTLLRSIAGDIKYSGEIVICDGKNRENTHKEKNVSWMPQNSSDILASSVGVSELMKVFESDDVVEFAYNEHLYWMFSDYDAKLVKTNLISTLSGGQQQIMIAAIALSTKKQIYLLDEVFRPLDVSIIEIYWGLLRKSIKSNMGIALIVTHDLLLAKEKADRVVVINSGKISLNKKSENIQIVEILAAMS